MMIRAMVQDRATGNLRADLMRSVTMHREHLIEFCRRLLRARSDNPPGDTTAVANVAADILRVVPGAEVEFVTAEYPIVNVVARLKGSGAGRRLVFNGHLDTFPVGDASKWSVDPLSGVAKAGRIYGRGVSDMKGGIACSLLAFQLLAGCRQAWRGELCVTLAGDEETMGVRGTEYLLKTVPYASGDAMISGDAGSAMVLRFGEKGMVWLDLVAKGRAAHGAHVHLGESAVERLMDALEALKRLRRLRSDIPRNVAEAMRKARRISESVSGLGEARVLRSVTVNLGRFCGGAAANLVADRAEANLDIRLPAGITTERVIETVDEILKPLSAVSYRVTRRHEPTWTDPRHEIVQMTKSALAEALGREPTVNMRVGASDTRLYRGRGIPSVVCGLTPHNMGAPDEHVLIDELQAVAQAHTLAAFDFLSTADQPKDSA